MRTVVLVEGTSDQAAVTALAARRGADLAAAGVEVVPMGGATSVRHHLDRLRDLDVRLAGLCDAAEEGWFRRGLTRAGYGPVRDRTDLEALGFFVCDSDLEDELIRALGVSAVHRVVEEAGDLRALRSLQKQPAQRDRTPAEQVHRFLGSGSGRKARYARLLVEALADDQVPPPLDRLLAHALAG
jgi:hypothetical protein